MASNNMIVVLACLVVLIQLSSSTATTYTVGDTTGWTVPTSSSFYSTWASGKSFVVGDVLAFNFQTGVHTVDEVSKSAYDSCSGSSPISSVTAGPANITIKTAGTHYFICTIATHCGYGQKLAITATAASSSTPTARSPSSSTTPSSSSSSPSAGGPTSTTTSPPPPSSAPTAIAGAGFLLPFLFVVAAFLL